MEIFLDCLPCFLRQALETSRLVTNREDIQAKIMNEFLNGMDLIISEQKR